MSIELRHRYTYMYMLTMNVFVKGILSEFYARELNGPK